MRSVCYLGIPRCGEGRGIRAVGDCRDWKTSKGEIRRTREFSTGLAVAVGEICWEDAARVGDFAALARACESWPYC